MSRHLRMIVLILTQRVIHVEGSRVREGGVVGTESALEANNASQEHLMVSRSKLGKVFRSEDPRHTPVQQGLNHLGLQHSDFQAKGDGHPIIELGAEAFEACPHEMDPSIYFEREVSVFVNNAV